MAVRFMYKKEDLWNCSGRNQKYGVKSIKIL